MPTIIALPSTKRKTSDSLRKCSLSNSFIKVGYKKDIRAVVTQCYLLFCLVYVKKYEESKVVTHKGMLHKLVKSGSG